MVDQIYFPVEQSKYQQIRNVEMRIFKNMKPDIIQKSAKGWTGTKYQNETTDKAIR